MTGAREMTKNYIEIGLADYGVKGNEVWDLDYVELERLIPDDHSCLFDFIDYDFSEDERELETYLACLDNGTEPDKDKLLRVYSDMLKCHPFFGLCPSNASALLNRIIAGHISRRFKDVDEGKQKALFRKCCLLMHKPTSSTDIAFEYRIMSDERHSLSPLRELQHRLHKWIYLVLDDTNTELANIDILQRAAYFNSRFGDSAGNLFIKASLQHIRTNKIKEMESDYEFQNLDELDELDAANGADSTADNATDTAASQTAADRLADGIPADMPVEDTDDKSAEVMRIIEQMENGTALEKEYYDSETMYAFTPDEKLPESMAKMIYAIDDVKYLGRLTYSIGGFPNLLDFEVNRMILSGTRVVRCRNCGRFFARERKNDVYCNRPVEGTGKTCYDVGLERAQGADEKWKKLLRQKYRTAYKRNQERVRRGSMSQEDFETWVTKAKDMRNITENSSVTVADRMRWFDI